MKEYLEDLESFFVWILWIYLWLLITIFEILDNLFAMTRKRIRGKQKHSQPNMVNSPNTAETNTADSENIEKPMEDAILKKIGDIKKTIAPVKDVTTTDTEHQNPQTSTTPTLKHPEVNSVQEFQKILGFDARVEKEIRSRENVAPQNKEDMGKIYDKEFTGMMELYQEHYDNYCKLCRNNGITPTYIEVAKAGISIVVRERDLTSETKNEMIENNTTYEGLRKSEFIRKIFDNPQQQQRLIPTSPTKGTVPREGTPATNLAGRDKILHTTPPQETTLSEIKDSPSTLTTSEGSKPVTLPNQIPRVRPQDQSTVNHPGDVAQTIETVPNKKTTIATIALDKEPPQSAIRSREQANCDAIPRTGRRQPKTAVNFPSSAATKNSPQNVSNKSNIFDPAKSFNSPNSNAVTQNGLQNNSDKVTFSREKRDAMWNKMKKTAWNCIKDWEDVLRENKNNLKDKVSEKYIPSSKNSVAEQPSYAEFSKEDAKDEFIPINFLMGKNLVLPTNLKSFEKELLISISMKEKDGAAKLEAELCDMEKQLMLEKYQEFDSEGVEPTTVVEEDAFLLKDSMEEEKSPGKKLEQVLSSNKLVRDEQHHNSLGSKQLDIIRQEIQQMQRQMNAYESQFHRKPNSIEKSLEEASTLSKHMMPLPEMQQLKCLPITSCQPVTSCLNESPGTIKKPERKSYSPETTFFHLREYGIVPERYNFPGNSVEVLTPSRELVNFPGIDVETPSTDFPNTEAEAENLSRDLVKESLSNELLQVLSQAPQNANSPEELPRVASSSLLSDFLSKSSFTFQDYRINEDNDDFERTVGVPPRPQEEKSNNIEEEDEVESEVETVIYREEISHQVTEEDEANQTINGSFESANAEEDAPQQETKPHVVESYQHNDPEPEPNSTEPGQVIDEEPRRQKPKVEPESPISLNPELWPELASDFSPSKKMKTPEKQTSQQTIDFHKEERSRAEYRKEYCCSMNILLPTPKVAREDNSPSQKSSQSKAERKRGTINSLFLPVENKSLVKLAPATNNNRDSLSPAKNTKLPYYNHGANSTTADSEGGAMVLYLTTTKNNQEKKNKNKEKEDKTPTKRSTPLKSHKVLDSSSQKTIPRKEVSQSLLKRRLEILSTLRGPKYLEYAEEIISLYKEENQHSPMEFESCFIKGNHSNLSRTIKDLTFNEMHEIQSFHLQIRRSLANQPFPRLCKDVAKSERTGLLNILKKSCKTINDRFKGQLSPLTFNDEQLSYLLKKGIIKTDEQTAETAYAASYKGHGGRALVLFNYIEHIRIIVSSRKGDLKRLFSEVQNIVNSLEEALSSKKHSYARHKKLGFINPSCIGNCFHCHVEVTFQCLEDEGVKIFLKRNGFEVIQQSHNTRLKKYVYIINNIRQFNHSELDIMRTMYNIIHRLGKIEERFGMEDHFDDLLEEL